VVAELPANLRPVDEAMRQGIDPPPQFRDKVRRWGGIDFGFRNPFAAVWGFTYDGVLYITGEHFARQKPLDYHREHLPNGLMWFADPSGAADIDALIRSNLAVRKGLNELRLGISAVTRRLENGTLKLLAGRAPNLLAEAELYRYSEDPRDRDPERPIDEHNHALGALRYLICTLDEAELARRPKPAA
jgi:hypothetical protein